ncbi:MAG: hypothetical protein ACO3ZX_00950 [Candidatus Nanopelagicales bacterium]
MSQFKYTRISPIVAGLQTITLIVLLLITIIGTLITGEFEARVLLPELLLYLIFIAGLAWVTRGLWRQRSWAKAPMIAVQLIVIGISYEDFWQSDPLRWKVTAIGLTAVALTAIAATLKITDSAK